MTTRAEKMEEALAGWSPLLVGGRPARQRPEGAAYALQMTRERARAALALPPETAPATRSLSAEDVASPPKAAKDCDTCVYDKPDDECSALDAATLEQLESDSVDCPLWAASPPKGTPGVCGARGNCSTCELPRGHFPSRHSGTMPNGGGEEWCAVPAEHAAGNCGCPVVSSPKGTPPNNLEGREEGTKVSLRLDALTGRTPPADVCHTGNGPTSQANAILIAAAPDLLAALKKALNESGCDGELCMHEWHDAARAAVARAEGKGEGT